MKIPYSDYLFRFLVVALVIAAGWLLFPFVPHLFMMLGLFPDEEMNSNFGYELINKVVIIWLVSSVLSLIYLFVRHKISLLFLSLPIIAPLLFAVLYTLSAQ